MFGDEQLLGQALAEILMSPDNEIDRQRRRGGLTAIDHPLHFDVSVRLQLQVTALRIPGKIVVKSSVNVDRKGVVALDKVCPRNRA